MTREVVRCGLAGAIVALASLGSGPVSGQAPSARVPVVVELFTSEGCSSCPPADALLIKLTQSSPVSGAQVITLGEHVDYWDQQGWRDPFSSASFTVRQQAYATRRGDDDVSTPQMVVDGTATFIGSDTSALISALTKAIAKPKAPISIAWTSSTKPTAIISLAASPLTVHSTVVVAITEDGLSSAVRRGENAGRTLSHASVTRRLSDVGQTSADGSFKLELPITIEPGWNRTNLKLVVFAQSSKRAVTAAASTPVAFSSPSVR
jgi:hypothetical protein